MPMHSPRTERANGWKRGYETISKDYHLMATTLCSDRIFTHSNPKHPLEAPTFLGPLKIFLKPVVRSFDLSPGFPERPLAAPSGAPGLESSVKSRPSVGGHVIGGNETLSCFKKRVCQQKRLTRDKQLCKYKCWHRCNIKRQWCLIKHKKIRA